MRGRRITLFGTLVVLIVVAGLLLVVSRPTAAPDGPAASASSPASPQGPSTRDANFLKALGGQVTSVSPAVAEGMGHRVCSALEEGATPSDIRGILVQKGLTPPEATRVVLAAVTMYCVEDQDKVMGVPESAAP